MAARCVTAATPPLTGWEKAKANAGGNALAYSLGLIMFSTSFGHLVDVTTRLHAHGWERFTGAGSIDLFIFFMNLEMRRDKKRRNKAMDNGIVIKRHFITYPMFCMMFGICLTIAGNWLDAGRGFQSHVNYIIPAVLMLLVTFAMDRREAMAEAVRSTAAGLVPAPGTVKPEPGTAAGTGTGNRGGNRDQRREPEPGTAAGTVAGTGTPSSPGTVSPPAPGSEVNLRPHTGDPVGDGEQGSGNPVWMPESIDLNGVHDATEITRRLAPAAVEFAGRNGKRMTLNDAQTVLGCQRQRAGELLRSARPEIERLTAQREAAARPARAVGQ